MNGVILMVGCEDFEDVLAIHLKKNVVMNDVDEAMLIKYSLDENLKLR